MGEKTELKACPFDDGRRKHRVMVERQQGRAGTACPSKWFRERVACSCGARGAEFKRPGCAITAWNTRAQPTPQDQGSLPDGWRPIETAPTNTDILVGNAKGMAVYSIENEDWRDDWEHVDDEPTHWMPLPTPPSVPAEKG